MKNYRFYCIVSFGLSVLLFWACRDDDDNAIESEDLKVVIEAGGETAELTKGITINFLVDDTLKVTAEGGDLTGSSSLGDYCVVTKTDGILNVELSSDADNVYLITASDSGTDYLLITDTGIDDSYVYGYVNICNPAEHWNKYCDVKDTIDVDDEEVYSEIEDALIFKYIDFPSEFILEYQSTTFPKYGKLAAISTPDYGKTQDTIYGSFIEKLSDGDTLVVMKYDTVSTTYQFKGVAGNKYQAILIEDLTEEFQTLYPNQTINKVLNLNGIGCEEVSLSLVEGM